MNKHIIIIDNSNISYTGEDINGTTLRGTETSLILLAENFVKKKIKVDFCTQTNQDKIVNNVRYFHIKKINKKINYDLAIVVSDANFFDYVVAKKKALFSVSNQPFEKFIRKRQLISFIKHKPIVITLCDYQFKKRSFITSFYGKKTIPITVDPIFVDRAIDLSLIPKKKVTYNIRSNRNLDRLIKIWIEKVYPLDNEAELFITPGLIQYSNQMKEKNIHLRKIGTRSEMIEEMKSYRALTYLGHKSDIFTLTAEEAVHLCMPVVTFGIGSLIDRIKHNENGFIARNDEEFAKYTVNLLNDDELYLNLKNKMFKNRLDNSWGKITKEWIKYFFNE